MFSQRKILSFCTLVLPWISALFIGRKSFIRFLPVATFVGYIFALISDIADKKRLWKVKNGLFPRFTLDISYLYGFFFVVTIWVFKLTYGNFFKYLFTNIVIDYIFSFPVLKFFKKVGTFELKKMRPQHFFLMSVFLAVILYIYQIIIERTIKNQQKI